MMKYMYVLFAMILLIPFQACEDFLEIDLPENQMTGASVFQNEDTAWAALTEIYSQMRSSGMFSGDVTGVSLLMGLYADELDAYVASSSSTANFYSHNIIPSNDRVFTLWKTAYAQIYATNAFLEGIEKSQGIQQEKKKKMEAEGRFLRALIHFGLVNLYGDIPYIKTTAYEDNSRVSRTEINKVYDEILSDLLEAKQFINEDYPDYERTRVNKAGIQALLARVYLYRQQWSEAEAEATDIIHNGTYALEEEISNVFKKESTSTILQFDSGIPGANTLEARIFIFENGPPQIAALSESLIDAFEEDDLRKENWIKKVTLGSNSWYHPYKYKIKDNTGTSVEYSILFRLEEQFLIRAEARAHLGKVTESLEDLNTIRRRANLRDFTTIDNEALKDAIAKERQREFFTEHGHRWFDLKRTDKAAIVLDPLKPGWQNRDVLLPIPELEISLNPNLLPQNSGY